MAAKRSLDPEPMEHQFVILSEIESDSTLEINNKKQWLIFRNSKEKKYRAVITGKIQEYLQPFGLMGYQYLYNKDFVRFKRYNTRQSEPKSDPKIWQESNELEGNKLEISFTFSEGCKTYDRVVRLCFGNLVNGEIVAYSSPTVIIGESDLLVNAEVNLLDYLYGERVILKQ